MVYYLSGNYGMVEKTINNATSLNANNSHYLAYLQLLGWTMVDQAKFALARDFFTQALDADNRLFYLGATLSSFFEKDLPAFKKYNEQLQKHPNWKTDALNTAWLSEKSISKITDFIKEN